MYVMISIKNTPEFVTFITTNKEMKSNILNKTTKCKNTKIFLKFYFYLQ